MAWGDDRQPTSKSWGPYRDHGLYILVPDAEADRRALMNILFGRGGSRTTVFARRLFRFTALFGAACVVLAGVLSVLTGT